MSEAPGEGSLLLSQPVVIDNGTATIKAGFAGSSKPKVRRSLRRGLLVSAIAAFS